MSRIIDIIRRVVQQELARSRSSQLGVVMAVFPHQSEDDQNNYEVDVRLKHEDLELRRVPVAVGHVGVAAPPRVGDLVLVQFVNGDINQALVAGRFYHDDERPPLHREDEILFEQRVPDGTLNHLRFTDDGTIYIQRDVAKPEDNSAARTSIKIDGASGDLVIQAGENISITVTNDSQIEIVAKDKPITMTCKKLTVDGEVELSNGKLTVSKGDVTIADGALTVSKGDVTISQGDLSVSNGATSTTISGNEITGA